MKLHEWIAQRPKVTRRELREHCGVTRQALHAWIALAQTPSFANIKKIREFTQGEVDFADFLGTRTHDRS